MTDNLSYKSFILGTLKQIRFWLLGVAVVEITWAIDLSLRPYIIKVIIDRLQHYDPNAPISIITTPMIIYILVSIFVISIWRLYDYVYLNISPILKRYIGDLLMSRMMKHSLILFQDNFAGNLANKIKDVMSGFPDILKIIDQQIAVILGMIIATFTMWTINYQFALLFLTWLSIFVLTVMLTLKRAKYLSEAQADIRSQTVGQMVDMLGNILNIKLFANNASESSRLMKYLNKYVIAEKRRDWWFLWIQAIQAVSFVTYQGCCFALLIHWFKAGAVTAGDFALLTMLNVAIIQEIWTLSKMILNAADLYGNIAQGLRIVLRPIEIKDRHGSTTLSVTKGNIEFDKLSFHYRDVAPIFTDKSIKITGGQKVGLVGYSGGGKSTFVNLILRLYEPKSGRILIDDQDIELVTQDSLHKNISMIPQDPSLFHRSLIENIRYGMPNATDAQVIEAAKQANAHEFILQIPNKYEALVGERGVKLSGGQRQRIAIARAMLKNAPILILDEATSQLDSVTEKEIQNSLWQAMQNKTVIVIAHRLSTLLNMDRILVFHQGKIIEDGPHAVLIAQGGLYKTLWDTQVGGFIGDV